MLVKNLHTVHVEITNKCNAKCPGCERHNTPNGEVHPELLMNPTEYSVDDFKNYFSNETIYKKEFYFGGTVDEPLMNKNVVDISEHILSNGGRVTIETNTGANTVELMECDEMGLLLDGLPINPRTTFNEYWPFLRLLMDITFIYSVSI